MGLAKIEDYTKDNLVELYLFLEKEIARTKIGVNNSGFTKYSVVGSAVLKYRKELKYIINQVVEDLIEDFGFGKISFQKEIEEYSAAMENAKDVIPNQFIKNMDEAQKILDNEKINELNKG